MKKILTLFSLVLFVIISVFVVKALDESNPTEVINVTKLGEAAHGDYNLEIRRTDLADATSGYLAALNLEVDPGYYVKGLSVKLGTEDLKLGFEAGSEHGAFFRLYEFSPGNLEYQFLIPSEATSSNKIEVNITYAKKAPININYFTYESDQYDDAHIYDLNNYDHEQVLVYNYLDGDIVLPSACTDNGCLLRLNFANDINYNAYKNIIMGEGNNNWINSGAVIFDDEGREKNAVIAEPRNCSDSLFTCDVFITKDFKDLTYGDLVVGYTRMFLYSPDFVGFDVEVDVHNFADILHELGNGVLSFTNDKKETNLEVFYGTRKIKLTRNTPRAIVNEGAENNSASLRNIDNVTGSGYGYNVTYSGNVATINIDSYYQDKMTLELNILNGGNNIFGGPVKINLDRFAFAGNAGQLLEVDSKGRNCNENNNGNTCSQGRYYSTQYRGVFNFMYINENEPAVVIDSLKDTFGINDGVLQISDAYPETGYARNKDFDPHAVALFYDENNMIVETKVFDLNEEVEAAGFVKKDVFNAVYSALNLSEELDKDYIFFRDQLQTPIKNIEYFEHHIDGTIMHDIVLISKAEAQEKGIKKIALFLVNGEIEENSIPELTYGIGEGRIMEIRGEN